MSDLEYHIGKFIEGLENDYILGLTDEEVTSFWKDLEDLIEKYGGCIEREKDFVESSGQLREKMQEEFNELGNEIIDLGLGLSKGKYCEGCLDLSMKGLISIIIKLKKLKTLQEENKS